MFDQLDADLKGDRVLVAGPAPLSGIDAIEAFAGFRLPASYRDFVKRYGAAIVGPFPVYGIGASEAMSAKDASVVDVTERFRGGEWPSVLETLVISTDHAGNPITLDGDGRVQRYDHDCGVIELISKSFEGFLEWCTSLGT